MSDIGDNRFRILKTRKKFEVYIAIADKHLLEKFDNTYLEVKKCFRSEIIKFKNEY
jgi:hypothetical protein